METDSYLIGRISGLDDACIDREAFFMEHSVGAIVPFIAYYFPGIEIVPKLINFRLSWERAAAMGKFLAKTTKENDFLLLSADFVHNKDLAETRERDRITGKFLSDYRERKNSYRITDIEVDTRKGLYVLLSYLKQKGSPRPDILLNTNTGEIAGQRDNITSYFFVLFGRE